MLYWVLVWVVGCASFLRYALFLAYLSKFPSCKLFRVVTHDCFRGTIALDICKERRSCEASALCWVCEYHASVEVKV